MLYIIKILFSLVSFYGMLSIFYYAYNVIKFRGVLDVHLSSSEEAEISLFIKLDDIHEFFIINKHFKIFNVLFVIILWTFLIVFMI